MTRLERGTSMSPELTRAQQALRPEHFGFSYTENGLEKPVRGIGTVVFKKLTHDLRSAALIQKEIFGMEDIDVMSPHYLSLLEEMGGSVFVAYEKGGNFTPQGWLGIGFVSPGRDNTQFSLSLGIKEGERNKGIGLDIRTLQASDAVNNGVGTMRWLQGARIPEIANLSFGKLKAKGTKFAIDRVADQKSRLFGPRATDRIWATWDLLSPDVHQALKEAHQGTQSHRAPTDSDLATVLHADIDNVDFLQKVKPSVILYKILTPSSLSERARGEEESRMRVVLGQLIDTERTIRQRGTNDDNTDIVQKIETPGDYIIDGVAIEENGNDKTLYYVLRLKPPVPSTTQPA